MAVSVPCGVLYLGCGITVNSKRRAVTSKWEDILKLFEFDKLNVLSPAAQCDAQTPELKLFEFDKTECAFTC
jgi:DUF971 family protein